MMKSYPFAIIADIHASLPSLMAVRDDLMSQPIDEIVVAGDFLGGPHPQETFEILREMGCGFILGYGEANLLKMHHGTAPEEWWTHRQFDLARWNYNHLEQRTFEFLEDLPEQFVVQPKGANPVRVQHGASWDINKLVFPHKEPEVFRRALEMIDESILVFAHTHPPEILRQNGKLAVNPGSVSNNLNRDTRASYATLSWDGSSWQPKLHYVFYNLDLVKKEFLESDF